MERASFARRYAELASVTFTERYKNKKSATKRLKAYITIDDMKDAGPNFRLFKRILDDSYEMAIEAAVTIGVPQKYWPSYEHGSVRVVAYSEGLVTPPHIDDDLFTLSLYRNKPENFEYTAGTPRQDVQELFPGIHYGNLMTQISPSFPASEHQVLPSFDGIQHILLYSAVTNLDVLLPSGISIREWKSSRRYLPHYPKSTEQEDNDWTLGG